MIQRSYQDGWNGCFKASWKSWSESSNFSFQVRSSHWFPERTRWVRPRLSLWSHELCESLKKRINAETSLRGVQCSLINPEARKIDYLQEKWTRVWLSATSSFSCRTVLPSVEFTNDLRDRWCLPFLNAPCHYDGCISKLLVSHTLSWKVGGLVRSHHDESRCTIIFLDSAGFVP